MQMTTSSEFADWQTFIAQEEEEGFHRLDHYFAQLTAEVVRGRVTDPKKVKDAHYMLKFKLTPTGEPKRKPSRKARLAASKAAWGIVAGKNLA
jgi:hypothetical protein